MDIVAVFIALVAAILLIIYLTDPFRAHTTKRTTDADIESWVAQMRDSSAAEHDIVSAASNQNAVDSPQPEATSAARFCHHCGSRVNPNHRFCPNCGTKLV